MGCYTLSWRITSLDLNNFTCPHKFHWDQFINNLARSHHWPNNRKHPAYDSRTIGTNFLNLTAMHSEWIMNIRVLAIKLVVRLRARTSATHQNMTSIHSSQRASHWCAMPNVRLATPVGYIPILRDNWWWWVFPGSRLTAG